MTREEAIKILEEYPWSTGTVEGDSCAVIFDAGLDAVEDALDMAVSALREQDVTDINVGNKWISVDERLPKEYQHIIIWTRWREIGEAYYNGERFVWDYDYDTADATHWMPLPEPPEEEV